MTGRFTQALRILVLAGSLLSASSPSGLAADETSDEHLLWINRLTHLSGNVVYFPMEFTDKKDLTWKGLFLELKNEVEESLTAHGFRLVQDRLHANLYLRVVVWKYTERLLPGESDRKPRERLLKLSLEGLSQSYGRRPVVVLSAWAVSPQNVDGARMRFLPIVANWMRQLEASPGLIREAAQAGPPGCVPRFGFELMRNIVEKVARFSAAEKAGLRVGDEIEAVDSVRYGNEEFYFRFDSAYEKLRSVVLTVLRGRTELELNLKPDIDCSP